MLALLKQLPNRDPLNVDTLSLDHKLLDQLMKVRMVQSGRELLFQLDVVEKRLLQLFRANAIPALDEGFHYYHLEADYLVVSSAAQHFALMSEKGIKVCTPMLPAADETRFVCEKKVPIIMSAESMCVINIFAKIGEKGCRCSWASL